MSDPCPPCHATGTHWYRPCTYCNGAGRIDSHRRSELRQRLTDDPSWFPPTTIAAIIDKDTAE